MYSFDRRLRRILTCCFAWLGALQYGLAESRVLDPNGFKHYVDQFNADDEETVLNAIPNNQAWEWIVANVPLFDCPDEQLEKIYYYRWWTFRKHIKQTPDGLVITEFIQPVRHAGPHNTISCAYGHHLAEGRWLRDQRPLDEYTDFWFHSGEDGGPASHVHKFSSWAAAALYDRYLVTGDKESLVLLLDELIADYEQWEAERQRPDGLFWQFDVRDGMEESISGSRTEQHVRPTINSYMAANASAIAKIANLAGCQEIVEQYNEKADSLRGKAIAAMWDDDARFFKVRRADGTLSDAREAIGYIPWMFNLAGPEHVEAWRQVNDPQGFSGEWGLTTAERRHPQFRTRGTGTCEWDGAVWPFATSQTLRGLANVLRGPEQSVVTKYDYLRHLQNYAKSHQKDGKPYLGEYLDETTGQWLIQGPKEARSRYYNHSTFNDLVIGGLVGLVPQADDTIVVDPLLPEDAWDWFCLEGVPYRGYQLTIVWDRTGDHYGQGPGLSVYCDGREIARNKSLDRLTTRLPRVSTQ
jgi:hypothetical protein